MPNGNSSPQINNWGMKKNKSLRNKIRNTFTRKYKSIANSLAGTKKLLKLGKNMEKNHPIFDAILKGDRRKIADLREDKEKREKINEVYNNTTPLLLAIDKKPDMIGELCAFSNIDMNKKTPDGVAAIHFAVAKGNLEALQKLLDMPCFTEECNSAPCSQNVLNLDLKDSNGLTPLDIAYLKSEANPNSSIYKSIIEELEKRKATRSQIKGGKRTRKNRKH